MSYSKKELYRLFKPSMPKGDHPIQPYWQEEDWPACFKAGNLDHYPTMPLAEARNQGLVHPTIDAILGVMPVGTVVSGGFAARSVNPKHPAEDIDLFFTSADAFHGAMNTLMDDSRPRPPELQGYKLAASYDLNKFYEHPNTYRFLKFERPGSPPIQLIKLLWYKSAAHVVDAFDITLAQFAYTKDGLTYNPQGLIDMVRGRVGLNKVQFPATTLRRMMKYAKKGYTICDGALRTLALAVEKTAKENPQDFANTFYID